MTQEKTKDPCKKNPLPFNDEDDPFYCESNMKFIEEGIADIEAGRVTEHELIEA